MTSRTRKDSWLIKNTCLSRVPSCIRPLMEKDVSECTMQRFPSLTHLISSLTTLTRALSLCSGPAALFQDLALTKETSSQSRLSSFSNCKTCVEPRLKLPSKPLSNRHQVCCLRYSSTWLYTCMVYWRHRLCLRWHRCRLKVNISTWWPIWSTKWIRWVLKKLCHSFTHRSMMLLITSFLARNFLSWKCFKERLWSLIKSIFATTR